MNNIRKDILEITNKYIEHSEEQAGVVYGEQFMLDELETYINKVREESYIKGATDFCDWNCLNADGGYVHDLRDFLQSIKEREK